MESYISKPERVNAIRLTPENVEEAAIACNGQVIRQEKSSDPKDVYIALEVFTMGGVRRIPMGEWLVQGGNGRFYPMLDDHFNQKYMKYEGD